MPTNNAPRALGSFTVNFGLVSIPVEILSVASPGESKISRNKLHRDCGNKLNNGPMVCSIHGEVQKEDIIMGHQVSKGKFVEITDDELKALPVGSKEVMQIESFSPVTEIDPCRYEKSYYLRPGKGGAKAFSLITRALDQAGKVGVAKVALRSGREQLCILRSAHNTLFVHTLFYENEMRVELDGALPTPVSEKELEIAGKLMAALEKPFDAEEHTDPYVAAFKDLVEAKLNDPNYKAPVVESIQREATLDLAAALEASLRATQAA